MSSSMSVVCYARKVLIFLERPKHQSPNLPYSKKVGSPLLLPFSTVLGFTLYKDPGNGSVAAHQFYSYDIELLYPPMLSTVARVN